MESVSEIPIASSYTTDQSLYLLNDQQSASNSLLYNMISVDGRLVSRPGFQEEFNVVFTGTKILHTVNYNQYLIFVSDQKLQVFDLITKQLKESITLTTPEVSAAGTYFAGTYVIATTANGFFVVDSSSGNIGVTQKKNIPAPVPFSKTASNKVIGASTITSLGNLLLIGGLYIQDGTNPAFVAGQYVMRSSFVTSPTATIPLPFTITDTTFDTAYPIPFIARGGISDMENFSNVVLISFSTGESFVVSQVSNSFSYPLTIKRISTSLGAIGDQCTVIIENYAYVLAQSTIALVSQAGQVQRVGEHIRSYIIDRTATPISSAISRRYQSIMWKFNSNTFSRGVNQILCCNFETFRTSILGVSSSAYTIQAITQSQALNEILILISANNKLSICKLDATKGYDTIQDTNIPISYSICCPAVTPNEKKPLSANTTDPYMISLVASCTEELTITAKKLAYSYSEKNPDRWTTITNADTILARIDTGTKTTNTYAANLGDSNATSGTFISLEITNSYPFSIEYATIQFCIAQG